MLLWGPGLSQWKRVAESHDGGVSAVIFARPAKNSTWPYVYRLSVSKSYRTRAGITRTTTALYPVELLRARNAVLKCYEQLVSSG